MSGTLVALQNTDFKLSEKVVTKIVTKHHSTVPMQLATSIFSFYIQLYEQPFPQFPTLRFLYGDTTVFPLVQTQSQNDTI